MNDAENDRDRGNALYVQGRYADAAECYARSLRQRPGDVDALNNLGAALGELGRQAEAVACYEEALRLQPGHAEAYYNLGNALRHSRRDAEAVECYGHALRLRPGLAEAHQNLAITLRRLGRLAEASASIRRALEIRPGDPASLVTRGLILAESGRLTEAVACYDEAIRRAAGLPDAHHNRAQAWLLLGEWERAWPEYEWRWRCADFASLELHGPRWDGSPLDGRTLLLQAEQGMGDTLQFVRYAPLAASRGGRVLLAAPQRLHPILRTVAGIDELVPLPLEPPLPAFDVACPLLSLPALFATTTAIVPAAVPYLHAEAGRVERWRSALADVQGLRLGIAWQGSTTMLPYDHWRSIPLQAFAPLARVEGVRLISLQLGPGSEQMAALDGRFPILDMTSQLDESAGAFLDTAALLANLDVVVTCDTAIAHLAGALGVRTWVALAAVPNWRWLLDRADSPWYPTVRLFRQTEPGCWDEPIGRMTESLGQLVAGRRAVAVAMTPGELVDRLTILAIKAERIREPAKLANVQAELASLRVLIPGVSAGTADLEELTASLRAVNEAIWDAEDAIRRCEARGDFGPEFIAVARTIYHNNDARAALKRRINERLGCRHQEEKNHPSC